MTAPFDRVDARPWPPGPKLTPKITLEGTRLTLTTDLAFTLTGHPPITGLRKDRGRSPLVSAAWRAFTPYPRRRPA